MWPTKILRRVLEDRKDPTARLGRRVGWHIGIRRDRNADRKHPIFALGEHPELRVREVFEVERVVQNCVWQSGRLEILACLVLASVARSVTKHVASMDWDLLKVRHVAMWKTEVDEVLNTGGLRGIDEVLGLALLLSLSLVNIETDTGQDGPDLWKWMSERYV